MKSVQFWRQMDNVFFANKIIVYRQCMRTLQFCHIVLS